MDRLIEKTILLADCTCDTRCNLIMCKETATKICILKWLPSFSCSTWGKIFVASVVLLEPWWPTNDPLSAILYNLILGLLQLILGGLMQNALQFSDWPYMSMLTSSATVHLPVHVWLWLGHRNSWPPLSKQPPKALITVHWNVGN